LAFTRFQDFLGGLVKIQRGLFFSGNEKASISELLDKLMGTAGEVSSIVTARQVLDHYAELNVGQKLEFFRNLEQNFNADPALVKLAYGNYEKNPSSSNLNKLLKASVPRRDELLNRLNQTPGATHDLVAMRTDLLGCLDEHPELDAVDEDFVRLFASWFGRSFLLLRTVNWSTSAAILERIIRYEAVHAITDWDDLRRRIDPPNRRCFAFFHPALVDEPLIFVEVALSKELPRSINSILEGEGEGEGKGEGNRSVDPSEYKTATFYSISNCQPGLKNISFGNLLIKQVVQELQGEFPAIKTFITLSPIPGFTHWLHTGDGAESEELAQLKKQLKPLPASAESVVDGEAEGVAEGVTEGVAESVAEHPELVRRAVFNYLLRAKKGKFPADSVARFHLGNGASIHQLHIGADLSDKGMAQSYGTMVSYLYDLKNIEANHERYATEGEIRFNDKLKPLLLKG